MSDVSDRARRAAAGQMIPVTQEEMERICNHMMDRQTMRTYPLQTIPTVPVESTESRLAREFWERCVLACVSDGINEANAISKWADRLTAEWRKRFDPPTDNENVDEATATHAIPGSTEYCDCWKRPQQVCDICQGWTGNEKDADPPKETPRSPLCNAHNHEGTFICGLLAGHCGPHGWDLEKGR